MGFVTTAKVAHTTVKVLEAAKKYIPLAIQAFTLVEKVQKQKDRREDKKRRGRKGNTSRKASRRARAVSSKTRPRNHPVEASVKY